jgi:hypothetical protein
MANLRKDARLEEVASRLEAARDGSVPGKGAFRGFEYSELVIVLGGLMEFAPEIPEVERQRILSQATFQAAAIGEITPAQLLLCCQMQEAEYLRKPLVDYRLLTGISLTSASKLPSLRIESTTISFGAHGPTAGRHRSLLYDDAKYSLGFELPTQYTDVTVKLKSRSPFEGAQVALDALDLARATWNLALNRGKEWRRSSGRPLAVNEILLCPFHSMHNDDGSLATSSWWYDPGYGKPTKSLFDKGQISSFLAFSKKLRRRLNQSNYRDELVDALLRYVRALDSSDMNDAFLRLWSLLEFLTNSSHDPYKVAIRRAAFMFAEREYSGQVLTHLMNHRNRFVHASKDTSEIESLLFLLKRYVEALLTFHIGNTFKFESRASAALFMDLPPNRSQLDARLRMLQNARKFISTP